LTDPKIIAVVGATGAQGGGLVHAIQSDKSGEYRARAITRNPNSPKAQELAALGAEVTAGDVDDAESLARAFDGAHGAFCVTFYWAHFSPEREYAEAGKMAQAAKNAGVRHAIWSTLEDTRKWVPLSDNRMPTLLGKYKVPHFDAKGEADQLFADAGVPTTNLLTSFYWDNFINFGLGPKTRPDGTVVYGMPMADRPLPGIAAEDIGKCAFGVFRAGDKYVGKTIGISGGHQTGDEIAAGFTRALGKKVTYLAVEPDLYRSFDFPGADDLGNMFQFKRDYNDYYCGVRSVEFSRGLNPELQSYETWIARNGERIPRD
jgi:uncharacterized protein YbjT (DUF2867 family)